MGDRPARVWVRSPTVLSAVRRSLSPPLKSAGFEASDQARWAEVEWLEYRTRRPARPALLGITHAPRRRLLLAELWQPARPAELLQAGPPRRAADRCRVWHYPAGERPGRLAREVAEAVAGWVAGATQPEAR